MSENFQVSDSITLPKSLVETLLLSSTNELRRQKRDRIFGYVFKALFVLLFVVLAAGIGGASLSRSGGDIHKPHLAFVELYGAVMPGQVDADKVIPALNQAFENVNSKAVVMRMNSPGGSPAQAGIIYDEITLLKAKYQGKQIIAVIEDMCASACYFIASAADKIVVNKSSMVGSIGVITTSFGFTEVMQKIGIEHRVITAGENKNLMDPFSPENPKVKEYWKGMLKEVHQQFITAVESGRGEKLKKSYPDLYSGLIWTGEKSIDIGLSDSVGNIFTVSRDLLGEVNNVNYTPAPDFMKTLAAKTAAEIKQINTQLNYPSFY